MQKLVAFAIAAALITHVADARNLGTSRQDKAATWAEGTVGSVVDGNQGKNGKANGNAGGTKPVEEEPVLDETPTDETAPDATSPDESSPESDGEVEV